MNEEKSNLNISKTCEEIGKEMDRLTIQKEYENMKTLLYKAEKVVREHDDVQYASIFFYIGTGYSVLADHERKSSKESKEADDYRKKSFYFFRKAIDYL